MNREYKTPCCKIYEISPMDAVLASSGFIDVGGTGVPDISERRGSWGDLWEKR